MKIKKPSCPSITGTEGYPRCHPNCRFQNETRPLVEGKIKVTSLSIHHRQLEEWKDFYSHRFTSTTGFLKQVLNRSSSQTLSCFVRIIIPFFRRYAITIFKINKNNLYYIPFKIHLTTSSGYLKGMSCFAPVTITG